MRSLRTFWIAAIQFLTVILGVAWGLALVRIDSFHRSEQLWPLTGGVAVLFLGWDGVRFSLRKRPGSVTKVTPWLCAALACLGIYVMTTDPLFWYDGNRTFFVGVMLLSTFLVCIGPLFRSRAWFGVCGAALFSVTTLSILIHNGFEQRSGGGFTAFWVS